MNSRARRVNEDLVLEVANNIRYKSLRAAAGMARITASALQRASSKLTRGTPVLWKLPLPFLYQAW